jgi:hypothetical protein
MTEERPPAPIVWPPVEDELTKWRNWHAERDAARKAAKAELKEQERQILAERQVEAAAQWDARVQGHIERERALMIDVVGCAIAHERQRQRAELAKLRLEIDALRHELAKLRGTGGAIVDLSPLGRRTNGA